jgi:hypothetical protein
VPFVLLSALLLGGAPTTGPAPTGFELPAPDPIVAAGNPQVLETCLGALIEVCLQVFCEAAVESACELACERPLDAACGDDDDDAPPPAPDRPKTTLRPELIQALNGMPRAELWGTCRDDVIQKSCREDFTACEAGLRSNLDAVAVQPTEWLIDQGCTDSSLRALLDRTAAPDPDPDPVGDPPPPMLEPETKY